MWTEKQNPFQTSTTSVRNTVLDLHDWRDCVIHHSPLYSICTDLPPTLHAFSGHFVRLQRSRGRPGCLGQFKVESFVLFYETVHRCKALARFVLHFHQSLLKFRAVGCVALLHLLQPFLFLLLQDGQEVLQLGHRERVPLKHTKKKERVTNVCLQLNNWYVKKKKLNFGFRENKSKTKG